MGHVLESIAAEVAVQDADFGALGVGMAVKGVGQADVVAAGPLLVARIHADVGDEQIEQAVAVIIKEDRTR